MKNQNTSTFSVLFKAILRFVFLAMFMAVVLFLCAGHLDWWEGWAYIGQGLVGIIISRGLLIARNPDTAMERAQAGQKENVQSWDRILMPLTALYLPIISWVVIGLDERFGWTPDLPDYIQIIALVFLFLGTMLGTWAMLENRFFSSHARIQTERGQHVISSGPYRFVRHPGYAGGVISWIAAPVLFSSYWAALVSLLAIAANVLRTFKEDKMLQEELPGYKEYAQKVRYRLVPGIW